MSETPFFDGRAAFALRLKQLQDRLGEQMEVALSHAGLEIGGRATGTVQFLYHSGASSITEIAAALGFSHQLATQRVNLLVREGILVIKDDPSDRRLRRVMLTDHGRAEAEKLQDFLPMLEAAYSSLFMEIGIDLHAAVLAANTALAQSPLVDRRSAESTETSSTLSSDPS